MYKETKTKPNIVPSPKNIAPKLVKNAPKVGQKSTLSISTPIEQIERKAGEENWKNPKKELEKVNLEGQSLFNSGKQGNVVHSTKEPPAMKPSKGRGRPKKEKVEKNCTKKLNDTEFGDDRGSAQ